MTSLIASLREQIEQLPLYGIERQTPRETASDT
jgi:hypothetical protein